MSKYSVDSTQGAEIGLAVDRLESDKWHQTYADPIELERRRREMPKKLRILGFNGISLNTDIMDMCCGHGEGLVALYDMGYRRLTGMDVAVSKQLSDDDRFRVFQGDVTSTGMPDASFDWVICLHSLHHMASPEKVKALVDEATRLLRPGGRLSIIDFPNSLQIRMAFWFFRRPRLHVTNYMRYFGKIIQEEWPFLRKYLPRWREVEAILWKGHLRVERCKRSLFYFFLTLRKEGDT